MTFSELHFHLLPGVDDGPRSVDESVALAAAAVADGTATITVTPHVHPAHVTDPTEIRERVRVLVDRLRGEQIDLTVLPGGELEHSMVERLSQRDLELIAQGPAGRRWLLLEPPFDGMDPGFTEAADEVRARGFGVVLAHPERSESSAQTRAAIAHELACGTVIQVTAGSLTGMSGPRTRELALDLLRSSPVAVIASDAHGLHRMPALTKAIVSLTAAGVPNPARFAAEIPRALLERGIIAGQTSLAA